MNSLAQTTTTPAPADPQLQVLPPPDAPPETRASKPRSRNGKIARLPFLERDMVNRMLRDNIPHSDIRNALDNYGFQVTLRNISNWKTRGGYAEWCAQQDSALSNHLLQDNLLSHLRTHDATALPEIGLQLAATSLSQFFLKSETQAQLAAEPGKFAPAISAICRLSRHLHTLQKYRDESAKELGYKYNPERLRREDEQAVELTREVFSAASIGDKPGDPTIPRRNYIPKEGYIPTQPD